VCLIECQQFWGPAVGGSENLHVLDITETCKIWALAAEITLLLGEAKKTPNRVSIISQSAGCRSVRGSHFGTAPGPALAAIRS